MVTAALAGLNARPDGRCDPGRPIRDGGGRRATRRHAARLGGPAGWIVCTPVVLGERRRWDTDPDSPLVSAENRGRGGRGEHDEIKPGSAARVMSISGSPTFDPAVPARDRLRWSS